MALLSWPPSSFRALQRHSGAWKRKLLSIHGVITNKPKARYLYCWGTGNGNGNLQYQRRLIHYNNTKHVHPQRTTTIVCLPQDHAKVETNQQQPQLWHCEGLWPTQCNVWSACSHTGSAWDLRWPNLCLLGPKYCLNRTEWEYVDKVMSYNIEIYSNNFMVAGQSVPTHAPTTTS